MRKGNMAPKALVWSALSVAAAISGMETHCLGGHAHEATYDIIGGPSLETVSDAFVRVRPAPEASHLCGKKDSDKAICVGSNIDETCTRAASSIPLSDVFDCQNCFASASMDLFYVLNISKRSLKGVEVGLRGNHLRAALEVHGHQEGSGPVTQGTVNLIDHHTVAEWSFMVAGLVPVHIKVSLPTVIDYALTWKGALDASAGVDLDIDLGDHYMRWTTDEGFTRHNTSTTIVTTPFITWNKGDAAADLALSLRSSLQVDIDKVMWYHFNMTPAFPSELGLEHTAQQQDQLCLNGDLDFNINHESDVHFNLFGKQEPIHHFGPQDLYHLHKDNVLHKCVDVRMVV